ncbi:flagellin lysine-N-methylase [Lacrimispora saccharolytica]|uniref:FliB family protein n=1 Tax=Lacrimispora saccharolytica (strain ATCC 35040 / DSM 2544 / NRCC 2533 / WM1) TaxID=610130 RepID=D9R295_LACSW|nr:flagellin lysine-N-methylase [Lacrimispora saccharolytica]ADL04745.1 FliB family protein [[Clostridium] saccharolyticum WM1]QRV21033.1 flagellin lysine-N-methylase [Lacrimispora saccharolytica]
MQVTIPHYYNKFHCVAGACQDTCCAGWTIMIDDSTKKRYRMRKDAFGRRLYHSIDWKNSSFKQYGRRCAFLNADNLCDIYREAGPGMLCKTCRDYPRHTEEYEGVREISLSLSCEEAAGLILGCQEPVHFLTKEDGRVESYPDFDFFFFTKLMDGRDLIFSILQNRDLDCRLRIAMVLGFSHDMQRRIREEKLYQLDGLMKRYEGTSGREFVVKKLTGCRIQNRMRYEKMKEWFTLFRKLEVLNPDWPQYMGSIVRELFDAGAESYEENRIAFDRYLIEEEDRKRQWELWSEQLMVYFIYTYFCGAVYDGNPYAKVKLAAVSTLLIQEMAQSVFKRKKGRLDFKEFVHLSHRFSREVEHSDVNLNTLEKIFCTEKSFGLEEILRLL